MRETTAYTNPYAIFDFDGTLVDSNEAFIQILRDFFAQHHTVLEEAFIENAKTLNFDQTCAAMQAATGCKESPAEIGAFINAKSDRFYAQEVELKPGVKAYVQALANQGVKMCVASATEDIIIWDVLRRLGLDACFQFVITVSQIDGITKDKPDIFFEAARRFGVEDRSQVTVYDDALGALKSAKSAGMCTICVYDDAGAGTMEEAKALCDGYIDSFTALV